MAQVRSSLTFSHVYGEKFKVISLPGKRKDKVESVIALKYKRMYYRNLTSQYSVLSIVSTKGLIFKNM